MTLIGPKLPLNVDVPKEVDSANEVGVGVSDGEQFGSGQVAPSHVPTTPASDPLAFGQSLKPAITVASGAAVAAAAGSLMDTPWSDLNPSAQQLLLRLGGVANDQQLGDLFDVLAGDSIWV